MLVVTGEYSTGMIRSTFAAVPRRLPVLWAKIVVVVVVVGTAMVVASVAAFLVAQAVLSGHRATFSLSDPAVLRVVIGTGVYLTLICLLGSAVAWIIRSTPGSLVGVFAADPGDPGAAAVPGQLGQGHRGLPAHRGGRQLLRRPCGCPGRCRRGPAWQ